jgi:hypothetical protein
MRLVTLYFRSARSLSKPTEEAAADKCLEIGAAPIDSAAQSRPRDHPRPSLNESIAFAKSSRRSIGTPANQASPGPPPSRSLVRARSTHSSNCVSSKGLAKKPIAPALIACSRIRSSGNAVMKIIGVVLP